MDRGEQQEVVAAAERGGAVGRGQQRLGLLAGQEADDRGVLPGDRDGQDPLDVQGVFGAAQRRVLVEGVDRGQARVAGGQCVAALVFQVVEESGDEVGVELLDVQSGGAGAELSLGVGQEQPEGVAVGGDGVRARESN